VLLDLASSSFFDFLKKNIVQKSLLKIPSQNFFQQLHCLQSTSPQHGSQFSPSLLGVPPQPPPTSQQGPPTLPLPIPVSTPTSIGITNGIEQQTVSIVSTNFYN
jgi:hypothetical protein